MKYMLLIYTSPDIPEPAPAEAEAEMAKWFSYSESLVAAGAMVGGDPLEGPVTATTVRVRDGKRLVTDGPFAETKEALMGYYLIDCATLDEALDWAEKVPASPFGSIEVRPIMDMPMPS